MQALPITAENLSGLAWKDQITAILASVRQLEQIVRTLPKEQDLAKAAMAQQLNRLQTFIWKILKEIETASTRS